MYQALISAAFILQRGPLLISTARIAAHNPAYNPKDGPQVTPEMSQTRFGLLGFPLAKIIMLHKCFFSKVVVHEPTPSGVRACGNISLVSRYPLPPGEPHSVP